MKLLNHLEAKRLISPPSWLASNLQYLTIMGSEAYGCATDLSDKDLYGFVIPPKDCVFPHTAGIIFVPQKEGGVWKPMHFLPNPAWAQWQQHGVVDKDAGKKYDFSILNIVRYFDLLVENNPNIIDSIFTSTECVMHQTRVASMVREQRRIFLHKGIWHRFKQYAMSQLHKMTSKEPDPKGNRAALREQFGFDVKFAYNVVRLLNECEQVLTTGEIDLRQINEHLKAIRRGDVSEADIRRWATEKEHVLEGLFATTRLPDEPPMGQVKALLFACLEEHYGTLEGVLIEPDAAIMALRQIEDVLRKNRGLIWGGVKQNGN